MSDLERFDLRPLIQKHSAGLREDGRTKVRWPTAVLLVWAPVLIGLSFPLTGARVSGVGLSGLLAASGLLVGSMVTAFVFLANLRIKVSETPRLALNLNLKELISETAAGCLYVSLIALILVALSVFKFSLSGISWPAWGDQLHLVLSHLGTSVLLATILHLLATFITIVRRLYGAYASLFAFETNETAAIPVNLPIKKNAS